nr:12736_t:CDS:2 [Entrophospora candida]
MLMEDARENNKQMWIVFQDMSKAFDLLDREILVKLNHNGIDQGDILSPLFWTIFYDPLLCEVNNNPNWGYKINVKWRSDLRYAYTKKLSEQVSSLAFMDDTTWLAKSKNEMENMLKVADSFYLYNGIKVNKNKSILLTINESTSTQDTWISFGNNSEEIYPKSKNESIRFLGIWINSNVIIPHIEYRWQLTPLTYKECNNLAVKIGRITEIRMRQLQLKEWLLTCPTECWLYENMKKFNNNMMAKILCIAKKVQFKFHCIHNTSSFDIQCGEIPLINIFKENYSIYNNTLRKKNLMFLDQFLYTEGSKMLMWQQLSCRWSFNQQGHIPKWFKELEIKVLENNYRIVKNKWKLNNQNKFNTRSKVLDIEDKRRKPWITAFNNINNSIILGKANLNIQRGQNELLLEHYINIRECSDELNDFHQSITLKKCSGCNLTSESSNNSCNITVGRSNCLKIECYIRKFFNNITNGQQIKLEIPLNELQNITKLQILEREEQILTESILIIEPHKQWILNSVNERYFDMLYNIYISNKEKSNLSFYIDGSVFNIGSNDVLMGSGIVQIENNKVVNKYSAGVSLWPSSIHTEISAFLLALLVCPENAKINNYTDSQTTINTYTYLTHNEMKTHSGNQWNEKADKLAKTGTNKFPISIKFDNFSYQKYKLMWNNLPVDDRTRSFIKKTTDAFNYQNWKNLKRNKNFNNEQYESIDWQSTFAALRGHIKKCSFLTSFKLNNQKAFRVKIFQNELPIMENLKKDDQIYILQDICVNN